MRPKNILSGLRFLKEVESKTQTYYVYEGKDNFVLMTISKRKKGFNFNVVSKGAVKYVEKKFAGEQGVTTTSLKNRSNKPEYITEMGG